MAASKMKLWLVCILQGCSKFSCIKYGLRSEIKELRFWSPVSEVHLDLQSDELTARICYMYLGSIMKEYKWSKIKLTNVLSKTNTWYFHLLLFINFVFNSNSDPVSLYMKPKPALVSVRFDMHYSFVSVYCS